jgi:predicted nucleic acid-binding protein
MRLVVADTGPLNYLVLIDAIDLLPKLFDQVLAPQTVRDELSARRTPERVRTWITQAPGWLDIRPDSTLGSSREMMALDRGEQAAISLAIEVKADLLLMDDRNGVVIARQNGLAATGTLGLLDLAARQGMIDLTEAFERLKTTSSTARPIRAARVPFARAAAVRCSRSHLKTSSLEIVR